MSYWLNNTRQSRAGAGRAEQVDNIIIIGLVHLTPQPSLDHCGVLDVVFIDLGEVIGMTADQRGDEEDNILAGNGENWLWEP